MKKKPRFAVKIFSILVICSFTFISCNSADKTNNDESTNSSEIITQSSITEGTSSQSITQTPQNEVSLIVC